MTFPEAMQSLESLGTAQNRQIFTKHGYGPSTFGVSFANIEKLRKSIRSDHGLARELWASGNSDARILATMIADPAQATSKELDALVKEVDFYVLASLYSRFVAASKFAKIKMESWVKSKNDFISQTGWSIFALLVAADSALTDDYLAKVLPDIEKHIHTSKNRTRHAMNMAVVAIGLRNPKLQKLALASAARIGKVEVDHGETGCKTPDAAAYIRKAAARRS